MTKIDPATVPPKMSKIERLMEDLRLQALSQGSDIPSEDHTGKTAADARQLILDLLGMSEKPPGEALYARYMAGHDVPDEEYSLRSCMLFLDRWAADTFPANEKGQIHFGRALIEMAISTMRVELKRQEEQAKRAAAEDHGPGPALK